MCVYGAKVLLHAEIFYHKGQKNARKIFIYFKIKKSEGHKSYTLPFLII